MRTWRISSGWVGREPSLESEPRTKLYLPGRSSVYDLPESPGGVLEIVRYGTRTGTGRCREGRTWIHTKLRVIEAIEGLHPDLQANPFGEFERLGERDVPIVDSRATQDVAAGISKCAGKRL